jgi:transposase
MELAQQIDFKSLYQLYQQEKKEKDELKVELMKMQLQLQKFAQMVFGSKSERFIPNPAQLVLDIKAEIADPVCKIGQAQKIEYIKTNQPRKRDLSELSVYLKDLPRIYETREPENIPEGAIRIGEDTYEVLEYTPGKLFVKVIVTPKYKVPSAGDKTQIIAAPAPKRPLPKCVAAPSLLAQLLIDKFADHIPVFRQIKRFERNGVLLPYNTILDWAGKTIDLLSVLYDALKKEVIQSGYIHVDETGLKVLCDKLTKKSKKIHDGYLWCYNNSIKKLVFFDYQHGRGEKCTEGILKNFRGIIQTDGWQVYEGVVSKREEITQICCLAHARRKFNDAKPYDKERAAYALTRFSQIYEIERKCKEQGLSYDEITKVRQDKSVPILDELHQWMLKEYKTLLPSDHITIAINYTLKLWDRLCYYTKDGMLNPDNNPVERSIRPVAIGRKNYLFAGSRQGAERLAMIYSLIGTCIMNNINPYDWLKDVIEKINDHPINKVSELLPHNWKLTTAEQLTASPAA